MLLRMAADRIYSVFGSGEFQPWSQEVDRYALDQARTGDGSVVILPAASALEGDDVFKNWGAMALDHYEQMGVDARVSALKTRADAHSDDCIAQLDGASMFYFSGGNPAYLSDTLRDTPFWQAMLERVDAGAVLAGCSAGACALGEMAPDSTAETLEDMTTGRWWVDGLRTLPGLAFGPHWDMLDRWMPGVEQIIREATPDDCTLITLDDETAIVGDGTTWRVFGNGKAGVAPGGETTAAYANGETFSL